MLIASQIKLRQAEESLFGPGAGNKLAHCIEPFYAFVHDASSLLYEIHRICLKFVLFHTCQYVWLD